MKENLIHSRTCVYNIHYHVVWSVKYRRKVLSPEIEFYIQNLAVEIGRAKGFIVDMLEVGEQEHIHCFVSAHPKVSISYIVKMLKGITARRVFMQYPELKKQLRKGVLWNHSYYVETVGSVSEENIRKYIEKQTNSY